MKLDNKIHTILMESLRPLINESMGVSRESMKIAYLLAKDIVSKYGVDFYLQKRKEFQEWKESHSDDEDDFYDEDYTPWDDIEISDSIVYNGEYYTYDIWYNHQVRGDHPITKADSNGNNDFDINYYTICSTIEGNFKDYLIDSAMNGENYNKIPSDVIKERMNSYILDKLYAVLLHELTHNADTGENPHDNYWLKYYPHRCLNELDIRDILYLFSDREMNARVASAGALMTSELAYMSDSIQDDDTLDMFQLNSEEISIFIKDSIENLDEWESELRSKEMALYLSSIQGHNNFQFRSRNDLLKVSNGRPYSIAYTLFRNDSRLRKNRRIKHLFETDFGGGEWAVYNFYKKKYEEYMRRIYKVCFYVYMKEIEEIKEKLEQQK